MFTKIRIGKLKLVVAVYQFRQIAKLRVRLRISLSSDCSEIDDCCQPGSKGQLPTSVLTLVPAKSNSQFDWLFDNKRLTNYSKELMLGFGEKLVYIGSLSQEGRAKD